MLFVCQYQKGSLKVYQGESRRGSVVFCSQIFFVSANSTLSTSKHRELIFAFAAKGCSFKKQQLQTRNESSEQGLDDFHNACKMKKLKILRIRCWPWRARIQQMVQSPLTLWIFKIFLRRILCGSPISIEWILKKHGISPQKTHDVTHNTALLFIKSELLLL